MLCLLAHDASGSQELFNSIGLLVSFKWLQLYKSPLVGGHSALRHHMGQLGDRLHLLVSEGRGHGDAEGGLKRRWSREIG